MGASLSRRVREVLQEALAHRFDVFVEHYPSLRRSENVGDFATPLGVKLKSIGTEVSVWF